MMRKVHQTKSAAATQKLGERTAQEILQSPLKKRAKVIGLIGDLGGGKTTFLQGFAKGFGIKQKILSPTFIIFKKFQVSGFRFQWFYHIDCYRVEKPKEISPYSSNNLFNIFIIFVLLFIVITLISIKLRKKQKM